MRFEGGVAFVTGGGHGIGRALCRAFAQRDMAVVVADVDEQAAWTVADGIVSDGGQALGIGCDVSLREDVARAAEATLDRFGKIHVVCNNAGVAATGMLGAFSRKDWNWVFDVNVFGVVNGVEVFLPLIRDHGEGGHFLNTASVGGFISGPLAEAYAASKHAVVAMSEGWAAQLAHERIAVSLLCPHFVRTSIADSEQRRAERYQTGQPLADDERAALARRGVATGLTPEVVAERALEGMENGEMYIFTHPTARAPLKDYFDRVLAAVENAENSAVLGRVVDWPPFRPA